MENINYLDKQGLTTLWQRVKSTVYPIVETTWSELKSRRDNATLVTGQQYRITDYECTTSRTTIAQSAGHQFDIIVIADAADKLNENARACVHDGDTYFADCNLGAWQVWYCLDNDTDRFCWADSTNGKGVIYRLIDEYDNDCPYDFKNMQFIRFKITATTVTNAGNVVGYYAATFTSKTGYTISSTDYQWHYTFTNSSLTDSSISSSTSCYANHIGALYHDVNNNRKQDINNNVFGITSDGTVYNNTMGADSYNNTVSGKMYNTSFGSNIYENIFIGGGTVNKDGIIFNILLCDMTAGNYWHDNIFCSCPCNHTYGSSCYNNVVNTSSLPAFGDYFHDNTIGANCDSITFGNDCYNNTVNGRSLDCIFGNNIFYNTISISYSVYGDRVQHSTFDIDYSHIGSRTAYLNISAGNYHYNTIKPCVMGTSSSVKSIRITSDYTTVSPADATTIEA